MKFDTLMLQELSQEEEMQIEGGGLFNDIGKAIEEKAREINWDKVGAVACGVITVAVAASPAGAIAAAGAAAVITYGIYTA